MMRVCDPMLPAFAGDFGVTTGEAALTVSAYAITYGLMQLVYGPLGDLWGKRRVAAYAAACCVPGNLLAVAASSLDMLVAARVLAAVASAGIIPLVLAWIGDSVPYEKRQAMLGRFLSASIAGMIAGQWASGVMTEYLGWRTVFGSLALLYFCSAFTLLRDRSLHRGERAPAGAGFVGQVRAVFAEKRARALLMVAVVEGAFAFAGVTFLASYLVHDFALSLSASAAIIALYGVGGLAYSWLAPSLLGRLGEARLMVWAALVLMGAWFAIALATHWGAVIPAALVAGFAFYVFHNIMQIRATQMVPAARGTAVALFASSMFLGISCGVAAAARIVDQAGYRPLFIACGAGLAAVGLVFSRMLRA